MLTQEAWQGGEYEGDQWRIWGNMQVLRWLRPSFFISRGSSLYYDEVDPFVDRRRRCGGGGLIQIGGRFSEDIEHSHNTFDRPDTGARVYTVNLLNTRTTYQFTKELAIRAIVRYDSQQDKVLTDFLGPTISGPAPSSMSGHGSLYQKRVSRPGVDRRRGQSTSRPSRGCS